MENKTQSSSAMANFNETPHLATILTNRCNLSCDYCLRKKTPNSIPFDKLERIIKEAHKHGYRSIGLTGGEVLLYPQLKKLLHLINEMGWNVLFETNGILLDNDWIKFISQLFSKDKIYFSISLDSHENKIHDSSRGKGSHEKAVAAIKMLKEAFFEVRIIAVLSGKNMINTEDIIKYLNFCDQLGVNSVGFQEIVPVGKNGKRFSGKNKNRDFCFEAVDQYKGRMIVTGPGKNNGSKFDCGRLNGGSLCLSPVGIHSCIFSEEIIIGSLDDFSVVRKNRLRSYSEFRKYAMIIKNMQDAKTCGECILAVKSVIKDFNKKDFSK